MYPFLRGFLRKCKSIAGTPRRMLVIHDSTSKKKHIVNTKKHKVRNAIKIGFIVQMPEVWDKEAPVFEALLEDKRFEVCMIIVPHYNFSKSCLEKYGEEQRYFEGKYPKVTAILLKDENDMPIDDSFDYIFYQRCWEHYLPPQLRCKNVIQHAITCYIPYCYHESPESTKYYQKKFFWYLNKFYCCSKDQYEQVKQIKGVECNYFGYPAIDTIQYMNSSHDSINILWTPRWTDDPEFGGTSFNRNRNRIFDLFKLSPDIRLTLRPHPLTFENAIKQGWMMPSDVNDYKEKVNKMGAALDNNKLIEETFQSTDVLITDFSSAIITFFLSGRPIIYCADYGFPLTDTFQNIMNSIYIAKDWADIYRITQDLINGKDPLYGKRQEVIKHIELRASSVDDIINDLVITVNGDADLTDQKY